MTERKPARPVHYVAAFRSGLAFDCYYAEHKASRESPIRLTKGQRHLVEKGWTPIGSHVIPPPRKHTDLRRVTCEECWTAIYRIAREQARR